ncbi:hypothetical protein K458DRAFT_400001 [Lentithecium fluviatile CBS 122367]|uniref:Uncharacterized protein n=1 Tax=Lentithecium fluviatile CBS 122367 TaxID=1168545 RepID=A0A6G1JF51_9PLEO|nr:hypothetical protein K458DRAFT_400001 [Lentithecium fluviatile CBS 122367]
MTGERKTTDLSSRLGVKRTKPSATKLTKSSPSITSPPKAAIATTKPKKEEIQRHRNPFNDMIHHRTSRDRDRNKEPVADSAPAKREEEQVVNSEAGCSASEDGGNGEVIIDTRAAERVAELERALATARKEQNAMREELAKVKEHGTVYRATIDENRRQLAGTYNHSQSLPGASHSNSRPTSSRSTSTPMDYEQDPEPRRSFSNHRRESLVEQNHDLRSRIANLQDQLRSQETHFQSKLNQVRSSHEAEWNDLISRLHATEKESQERLQQLLSLKSSISSLTRMDAQVTDSELSEMLSQLANRVREWVISNFRRTKLDLSNVPPETAKALEEIVPAYRSIDPSDRLALYQALISSAMMNIFREPIIVGLPESGPLASMRQIAAYIYDADADYCDWRRTTIRSLEKSNAKGMLREEQERLTHRLSNEIGHHLFTLTSMNLTPNAQTTLAGILDAAAGLQNTLLLQKAQYRLLFFRNQNDQEVRFDEERMDSINNLDNGMDDDMAIDRRFAFCVFPCLEKSGDEYGEHADVRNVLLKASICCVAD